MPITYWARIDSGSANNPALNLTTVDALQFSFVNETSGGGAGDYYLDQPAGGGVDPDTVVDIGGTTYTFTYEFTGTLPTLNKDGAQQVPDQFEGVEVAVITLHDYPTTGEDTRLFIMPGLTATQADMDAFGNGAIDIQNVDETPSPTAICFHAGTRIATPRGEIAVEDLNAGDVVETLDHGPLPILWAGSTRLTWPGACEKARPIRIAAGALGPGRPRADLVVSPQHRMLLRFADLSHRYGSGEVLLPAIGMTKCPKIRRMQGRKRAHYFHILLPKHAIVWANGAEAESFYPGKTAMKMLAPAHRLAIRGLVPGLASMPNHGYGPLARQTLTRAEGERLLSRPDRTDALQMPPTDQTTDITPGSAHLAA